MAILGGDNVQDEELNRVTELIYALDELCENRLKDSDPEEVLDIDELNNQIADALNVLTRVYIVLNVNRKMPQGFISNKISN